MELKLSDLDNYKLSDIDFLTIEQLETMTPQDLVTAVEAVRKIAESRCDPNQLLNENQCVYVVNVIHKHFSLFNTVLGGEIAFVPKQITAALALWGIKKIADVALDQITSHQDEIKIILVQCYNFLKDFLS